jgi:hypothetical protein
MKLTTLLRVIKDYGVVVGIIVALVAIIAYVPLLVVPATVGLVFAVPVVLAVAALDIAESRSIACDERYFARKKAHYRNLGANY